MRLDPLILPMINRPQIQGCLHRAEGPLHFEKLLIAQSDVFRAQGVISGGDDVLAVQMRFLPDLALVDLDASIFELPEIASHRPVGQQRADALLMGLVSLIPQLFDGLFNPDKDILPGGLVFFGLLGIMNQDKPSASFPVADNHLFDRDTDYSHLMTDTFAVLSNGVCTYCCRDYEGDLNLGNANDQTLREIYFGARATRIREEGRRGRMVENRCWICRGTLVYQKDGKAVPSRNLITEFYLFRDHLRRYGTAGTIRKIGENLRLRFRTG